MSSRSTNEYNLGDPQLPTVDPEVNYQNNPALNYFNQPLSGFGVSNFRNKFPQTVVPMTNIPSTISRATTDFQLENVHQFTNPITDFKANDTPISCLMSIIKTIK